MRIPMDGASPTAPSSLLSEGGEEKGHANPSAPVRANSPKDGCFNEMSQLMSLLAECSWRNVLGNGNAASLSAGIAQLSRLCPILEMGIHGTSWVKDLVLHPSISQEQLAACLLSGCD